LQAYAPRLRGWLDLQRPNGRGPACVPGQVRRRMLLHKAFPQGGQPAWDSQGPGYDGEMKVSTRTLTLARLVFFAAALSAAAAAQVVYVVDDDGGPGVAFTDIQPAVNIAGPLDRIDVRDGVYGSVSIDRPVTIMGLTANADLVRVGSVSMDSIAGPGSIVLSKMTLGPVTASQVEVTMLLDRVQAPGVSCSSCTDCRLQHVALAPQSSFSAPGGNAALYLSDSFVQIAGSVLAGADGFDVIGGVGGPAIRMESQSRLAITASNVQGGVGGSSMFGISNQRYGERGGDGVQIIGGTAELLLLDSDVGGGASGYGTLGSDGPGTAFFGCNASTTITRCRSSITGAPPSAACVSATTTHNGLLSMLLLAGNTPGQPGSIEFRGRGGAFARVVQGRNFAFAPAPFGFLPRLISVDRTSSVGPFAAGTATTWNYITSPFRRGSRIHFQVAQPRLTPGLDWSNAMTIIID